MSLCLCACAVGPDFQRPQPPAQGGYGEPSATEIPAATRDAGGEAQRLRAGNDLAADWWTLYRSEPLDRLVATALRDNATLASASAALRVAQESFNVSRGELLYPGADLHASVARDQASGAQLGLDTPATRFNLYNVAVDVSYTLDLFGGVRRQLEALKAQVDVQDEQLRAARLALTANVVTAVIREAQLRDQIQALRDVEKFQRESLAIVQRRFNMGAVTRADVLSQSSALASTVAAIPPLERQRAQLRHQLAVYLGKTPAQLDLSELDLNRLALPTDLPVSVPSELVRQRPDILAAEALLHQASALVGVATANLYPQITLSANAGYESLSSSKLFNAASAAWGVGAGLVQPLFHGAALLAAEREAQATFDEAAADYRQTVLTAFANVADALRALATDAQALSAYADAYDQAHEGAQLVQRQFDLGAASYLSLLSAQQQYRQSAVNLVQARADRLADTAALFQAIGGGWWNAPAAPVARD